jgi:hypothetical protein
VTASEGLQNESEVKRQAMKPTPSVMRLVYLLAAAVLIALPGCITVRRDAEPTTTVTTTETRSSTVVPSATTTVERTTY